MGANGSSVPRFLEQLLAIKIQDQNVFLQIDEGISNSVLVPHKNSVLNTISLKIIGMHDNMAESIMITFNVTKSS